MEINIYQNCPCHTDKKIKFCCGKSVVADLDSVLAKHAAGQTSTALGLLERAIKKSGPQDCLITIQSKLLMESGDLEKAKEVNEQFVAKNPEHSTGHLHRMMIYSAEQDVDRAIESLQDLMDSITGNSIPVSLAPPIRVVGVLLLGRRSFLAARAYLKFSAMLKPDQETSRLIEISYRESGNAVQKTDLLLDTPPEGAAWEKKVTNVLRAIKRGQFRKGLRMLQKANADFPGVHSIQRGIAMLHVVLDRKAEACEVLADVAGSESFEAWQRVEAQCLKNSLREDQELTLDVNRYSLEVNDFAKVSEDASSCKQLEPMPTVLDHDPFGEGPAPRAGYLVLDKDKIAEDSAGLDKLDLADVPMVRGELLLYGKQTDRSARIEFVKPNDVVCEQSLQIVREIFSEFIDGEPEVTRIDSVMQLDHETNFDWRLPVTVPRETIDRLVKEQFRKTLTEKLVGLKTPMLDGLSLTDAAGKPEMTTAVQAFILFLQQMNGGERFPTGLIDELVKELSINELPPVVLDGATLDDISPAIHASIDVEKLSDDQLVGLHHYSFRIGNLAVVAKTNPELLKRPTAHQMISKRVLLTTQAQMEPDSEKGLELLAQMRADAKRDGEPLGQLLVDEFEYRLSRNLVGKKMKDLVRAIEARHIEEPGVESRLTMVLERYGLLDPAMLAGGAEGGSSPLDSVPASAWQAKPAASAVAGGDGDGDGKLWLPE